ncbi:hypothetical protein [Actinomycetospora straminea]|uniref:hypothetical protein n=1 Tax=Actinomycetospora straminea TaxID=663607 RepID=UPI002365957E|nr:hypothetical protein [Actinomycetospora straminea]MDD7936119.1 hypothetical protein [Actinomycetospora straminea]
MLHEPTIPTLAPPAAAPDTLPAPRPSSIEEPSTPSAPEPQAVTIRSSGRQTPPADLRALARRARRDTVAARELAAALLARGWDTGRAAAATGLAEGAVAALAGVRRPGTAAGAVAADVAARAARRAAGTEELPPAPRARPAS